MRVDQGHRSESKFRITIYEPDRRLAFAGISDPFRCIYELQEGHQSGSARLFFKFELLEIQMIMRPFEPMIRTAVQDGAERTVQNIKRLVESEPGA